MINAKLLDAATTASMLWWRLGPLRAWTHCLADMRRDRSAIEGHQLLPACVMREGLQEHPMYLASDVFAFIRAIEARGLALRSQRLRVQEADVDLREPDWRKRVISAPQA